VPGRTLEQLILHISNVVAPVVLCVLVGFALAKFKLPYDNKMITMLVSNVGYPTLIIAHLSAGHVEFDAFLVMMAATVAAVACFGVIAFAFLSVVGLSRRGFLSPLMLNNVGNIGFPICALAFGAVGGAYAIAFLAVVLVGVFTIGMWLPMGKVTLGDLVRKPVIYAVIVALVLMATDTRLPTPIDRTFTILGGLAVPLLLLTLGHTLATLQTGALWRGCYLALFHLAMAGGVAFALVHLFGFTGVERGVFILMCMMPPSVATYLWVDMYDPDHAPDVAGFILIATLLSVIVLPLVLAFWV